MDVLHKHPKYVRGIDGCTTQAFPGATIARLADFVSNGRINSKNIYFVIVHVGTNNVSSSQSVDTILSYYGDLIHKIKSKTDAKIIFTSLLPRLVDFKLSERKLNKVNSELRRLCNRRSLLFCNLIVHFYTITNQTCLFTHPKIDSTKKFLEQSYSERKLSLLSNISVYRLF